LKPIPIAVSDSLEEITISSIGGLGDGLSSLKGKPLFVEKSAAGDQLKVRITNQTKESLRGEIVEIIKAGPERVTPPCPYYTRCGGCSLQHISVGAYQAGKRKVLSDALAHSGFPDTKADVTFLPAASRRRAELKFDGARFAYYAPRSRDLVAIDNCLILEPALQALLAPLAKQLGKWYAVRAIKTVSLTATDSGIDMVLECSSRVEDTAALSQLAETLNIARISMAVAGEQTLTVVSRAAVTLTIGGYDIALPPDAFLQASKEGQKLITDAVVAALADSKSVADLFAGIGSYSFALSKHMKRHLVESDIGMVKGLKAMIHLHGLNRNMSAAARDLFTAPLVPKELEKFDAVIINPPRAGAKTQCEQIAKSNIKRVVMVSCNPASFARDAKTLKNAGFTLESAQGIDQFVYSPHLEIVAVFAR